MDLLGREPVATSPSPAACRRVLGRYALYGEIAHGGMATVHLGRLLGPAGFSRTVALKRLHPQFARDADFVGMFRDEARLSARVRHPNVVQVLDVLGEDEVFLVLEYVHGESLARLLRRTRERGERVPPPVAAAVMCGVLAGLHAAHEATGEDGAPLHLVHRDMSPQNVMVCGDGLARVLDFGIAKARGRVYTTREGQLKGKLGYIAPEQLQHLPVDRRTDVYAAAVTLWELLTGCKLFKAETEWEILGMIQAGARRAPSALVPGLPPALDAVVMRGLAVDPAERFATAKQMEVELEAALPLASTRQVAAWVEAVAGQALRARQELVAQIEALPAPAVLEATPSLPAVQAVLVAEGTMTGTGSAPSAIARRLTPSSARVGLAPSGPLSSAPPSSLTASGTGALLVTHTSVVPEPPPRRAGAALAVALGALLAFVAGGAALLGVKAPARGAAAASPALAPSTERDRAGAPSGLGPAAAIGQVAAGGRAGEPAQMSPVARAMHTTLPGTAGADDARAQVPAEGASSGRAGDLAERAMEARGEAVPAIAGPHAAAAAAPPPARGPGAPARVRARTPRAEEPRPTPDAEPAIAPSPAPPAGDACEPPYTIDAAGIRHPKAECL